MPELAEPPCPCSQRTIEDQYGTAVRRAIENGAWCGNPGVPWTGGDGARHRDGWCDDCIDKRREWCRHD